MRYLTTIPMKLKTQNGEIELKPGETFTPKNEDAIKGLLAEGKVRKIAVKEWSEVLGCHLWVVADDGDIRALKSQEITEAIYTADEVKKLKGLSKDSLKEIHKVKEIFENSKVEEITKKVKN